MSSISHHKATNPDSKHPKFGHLPLSTSGPQDCAVTGSALLHTPYFNKGAAFPAGERKQFKLTGLLPQNVSTLEQQVKRAYQQYSSRTDDLAKNTFMTSLKGQNEVLFYRVSLVFFGVIPVPVFPRSSLPKLDGFSILVALSSWHISLYFFLSFNFSFLIDGCT
jgi:hypothetical protein